jgi:hypothetical protein
MNLVREVMANKIIADDVTAELSPGPGYPDRAALARELPNRATAVPFGGVGESGFGRFHGDAGLREFSYAKSTARKRFDLGKDLQSFPRTPHQFDVVRKALRLRYGRSFH